MIARLRCPPPIGQSNRYGVYLEMPQDALVPRKHEDGIDDPKRENGLASLDARAMIHLLVP